MPGTYGTVGANFSSRKSYRWASRAHGIVLRSCSSEHLEERIAAGEVVVDAEISRQMLGRRRSAEAVERLTQRELEVLSLMAEGLSNQATCERLVLTAKTVESHVSSIFTKLDPPVSPDDHRRVRAVLHYLGARSNA